MIHENCCKRFFTGGIMLQNNEQDVEAKQDTALSPFLKFCVLTDKLDIECTEAIIDDIWKQIALDSRSVQPRDIRYAWENLPARHPVREMLAKATLPDYFNGIMNDNNKFTREIEEVEGYAADLLRVYSSQARGEIPFT